jgi:hypothetical protein
MATITKKQWRIARTDSGTPPVVYEFPEAASQTFPASGLVTLNANGEVTGASGDDDTIFWGIAENPGQNSTNKKARVFRLTTDLVFIGNVLGAAAADHVLVQADMGTMGINFDDTPKNWHLDSGEQGGADDRVQVLKPAPGSEYGDTNGEVYFKFLSSAIQYP